MASSSMVAVGSLASAVPPAGMGLRPVEHLEKLYVQNKFELTKHISDAAHARKQFYGGENWYSWWYVAPDEAEYHNRIEHQDPAPEHCKALINVVMQTYQNRPFSWVTGPRGQPHLEYLLESRGFLLEEEEAVMAVRLLDVVPLFPVLMPRGLRIAPVTNPDGVKAWVKTWTHNASSPGMQDWTRIYTQLFRSLPVSQFCMYIATKNNQTVGTVYIHCFGGSASIHAVDVLPEFRKQGIGRALTAWAMSEAFKRGCTFCTLTSSPMGRRLFGNLGFRKFGSVKEYSWEPSHQQQSPKRQTQAVPKKTIETEQRGKGSDEDDGFESIDKEQTLEETRRDAEDDGWCYL